jgi:hypothetical protein
MTYNTKRFAMERRVCDVKISLQLLLNLSLAVIGSWVEQRQD